MKRVRVRRFVIVTLAALAVAVGWPTLLAVRTMLATPNIAVDYARQMRERQEAMLGTEPADADARWGAFVDLVMRGSEDIAAVERAWQDRLRRGEVEPRDDMDWGLVDVGHVLRGADIPDAIEREVEAIAAVEADGIFEGLAGLVNGPIGLRPAPAGNDEALLLPDLPELARARGLAKTRAASMRLALHAGDEEEVIAAFEQLMTISETVGHQRTLVDHLVGQAVAALALDELRRELDEVAVGDDTCRRLTDVIRRYRRPPIALALEGERAIFHDFVQRTFSDDGEGDGHIIPRLAEGPDTSLIEQLLMAFASRFYLASRREQVETYDAVMDTFIAYAEAPVEERDGPLVDDPPDDRAARRLSLVWLMMPALGKAIDNCDHSTMQLEGTLVRLALERFETRHGRPPAALGELVPEYLPETPRDPINGGPFGYRLLADDSEGRAYELYSYGRNGVDDADAENRWDDRLDFALNEPREAIE